VEEKQQVVLQVRFGHAASQSATGAAQGNWDTLCLSVKRSCFKLHV
jgi:hypothetical protein